MKITFLGTGGSLGVPIVGCSCKVCRSSDRRNRRLRPSLLIQFDNKVILIDASPDFRQQALENGLHRIDVLLITHAHADHCLGLDDLRIVVDRYQKQLPLYASQETVRRLRQTFGYFFNTPIWKTNTPRLKPCAVNGSFEIFGTQFIPVEVLHDKMNVLGFRFGDVAYITDASGVPSESKKLLQNLDLLIINALRYKPHPKHFSLGQAVDFIASAKPKRALLTHMSHELEYNTLQRELPQGVSPAYDSLTVEI